MLEQHAPASTLRYALPALLSGGHCLYGCIYTHCGAALESFVYVIHCVLNQGQHELQCIGPEARTLTLQKPS